MRKILSWSAPLAVMLAPVSATAQDASADQVLVERADDDPGGMGESGSDWLGGLADAFAAEPLTAEQAARLPVATALVDQILPPGSWQDVMGSLLDTTLSPLAEAIEPDARSIVARQLGLSTYDLDAITDAQAEQAAALFDPAWRERARREAEAAPQLAARAMAAFEPGMRQAMAELYAIYFTDAELAGIADFFATPVGAIYARQSLRMSSDPRLAGAMMQQMPAMMEAMSAVEADLAALNADLPSARDLVDLDETERKALARLTGLSVEDIDYLSGLPLDPADAAWDESLDWADPEALEAPDAAVDAAVAAVEKAARTASQAAD